VGKRANHAPGRLLLFHAKHGLAALVLESQPKQRSHQLINRRVASFACRMEAISGTGVKQATSTQADDCVISASSGFNDQRISLARVCPTGASRCAADTHAVID